MGLYYFRAIFKKKGYIEYPTWFSIEHQLLRVIYETFELNAITRSKNE